MGRRIVHPARRAREADGAVHTGEGDQVLRPAALADKACEAPFQPAARQVGAQLLRDVAREAAAAVGTGGDEVVLEAVELFGHEAIEQPRLAA
jgi:hypothetical protein